MTLTKGNPALTIAATEYGRQVFKARVCTMGFLVPEQPMSRRTAMWSGFGIGLLVLAPGMQPSSIETVPLPDDARQFTPAFAASVTDKINRLADNPGRMLRFEFPTLSGEKKAVFLSLERPRGRGIAYPVLRSEGLPPLMLQHNGQAPVHHIQFTSLDTTLVERLKEKLKRFWAWGKEQMRGKDSFTVAIQAVAAAVAVWLAAAVGSAVLGGIAFFASYLVVLALIIAGAAVIAGLFRGFDSAPARRERAQHIFVEKAGKFSEIVQVIAT